MQRIAILVITLIGLVCCVLAVLDARAQQAEELAPLRPAPADRAGYPEAHHLRGSLSRASIAPAQRLDGARRGLG